MKLHFVYMTAKDRHEANHMGRLLIEERLAACVNVIDGMTSLYWWEGKVQEEAEAVLIAKTREDLVPKLIERVKGIHSYSCPCIVSWPLTEGNAEFLKWIGEQTE